MKRIIFVLLCLVSITAVQTTAQNKIEKFPAGATLTAPLEIGGGGIKPLTLYFLDGKYRKFDIYGNYNTVDMKISADIEKGDGNITDANINKAKSIILDMYKQVLRDYYKKGLDPKNIVVYTSSGVGRAKNIKLLTDALESYLSDPKNFTDLSDLLSPEKCIYIKKVYVVGPDEEAKYTIAGSIPADDIDIAFSLDQGGSNGKGGYVVESNGGYIGVPVTYDLGSTRIAERVRQYVKVNPSNEYEYMQSYIKVCDSLFDSGLASDIFSVLGNIDGAETKTKLYLTGGYAFIISTLLYPEANLDEQMVRLRYDDIKQFVQNVRDTAAYNRMKLRDLSSLSEAQQKSYKKALGIYNQLQLIAASKLFLTYVDAVKGREKAIIFNRNGLQAMPSVLLSRYLRGSISLKK